MLTDIEIKKVAAPEQRREIPDGKIAGLFLVVQPSGAKSWAVRYRFAGAPRKLTLGPYPTVSLGAARKRAQGAMGDVSKGVDPAAVKAAARAAAKIAEAPSDRVADIAAEFVEKHLQRKAGESWAREGARLLKREVLPALGMKRLGEVKKSDINDMLDAIVDRGAPIIANRTLAIFRRFCNWATERGIITLSPCEKVKAPAAEQTRDRILSDDEIRLAWNAFDKIDWPFGPLAKLLLLTGARRDEIGSARWSDVDLEAKTLAIPKERSKNKTAHEIPLSDDAVSILSTLPRIGTRNDALVFSTNGRTAVSGFSNAKEQIDAAIAEARGDAAEPIEPWVLHDLRRTAASGMAGLGIAPHVVEKVLNHKSGTIKGVALVYNRYSYATEARAALDAWSRRLEAIVTGKPAGNVVELAKARAS